MAGLLPLPESRDEIRHIQSERKKVAFERAKSARWYKGKLDHISAHNLDEPEVWSQIPIVTKDVLREFNHTQVMENFNIAPLTAIAEY